MNHKPIVVTTDGDEHFQGWAIPGNYWNGFEMPLFERAEAERLCKWLESRNDDLNQCVVCDWSGDNLYITHVDQDPSEATRYFPTEIHTDYVGVREVWGIGAGSWTWSQAEAEPPVVTKAQIEGSRIDLDLMYPHMVGQLKPQPEWVAHLKDGEEFTTVFEQSRLRINSIGEVIFDFDRHGIQADWNVIGSLPNHVVKAFGHEHSCIIYWQQGDIENQAHNLGYHLKDAEVNEVLARMEKTHDPQHGMHWEWVDQTIMQVIGERN